MALEGTFFDLSRCTPRSVLSPVPRKGFWRTAPWEGAHQDQRLSGTMLIVGQETRPRPITLDPQLDGPHELSLGMAQFGAMGPSSIMIRLDDDPGWVILRNDPFDDAANAHHTRQSVQDCPFRVADMTGRKVQLAQVEWGDRPEGAMLAYLRAVPTNQARLERVRSRGDKRLVAMNDGHGIFYMGVTEPEELWYFILPYRDSGYRSMLFCISGADHCNYPTEVGSLEGEGLDDFPTAGYRRYTESLAGLMRRGIDPIATVRDMCRSIGLEFHLSIRMGAFAMEPPYDGVFISRFYRRHPELRCVDHDGRAISRLSYAFPDVRRHVLAIVDELLAYRPDGINFIFPRAQPFVLYEEPFLQRFRSLHGTDPRELPEDDRDVLELRAAIMSEFMAEARSRTRKHGAELSALVLSDRRSNELHGLDVVRWAREGLLDEIHPTVWDYRRWRVVPEADYLVEPCRAGNCRLIVNLHPNEIDNEEFLSTAHRYHREGVDGFSIWDGNPTQPVTWHLYRAIAHVDQLSGAAAGPPAEPTTFPLTQLGDFVMDRYKSSWSY